MIPSSTESQIHELEQSLRAFATALSRGDLERALRWARVAAAVVEAEPTLLDEAIR